MALVIEIGLSVCFGKVIGGGVGIMWYSMLGALVPLDNAGHYIHWHVIDISVANFVVIVAMIVTFVAALLLPFPGRARRKEKS